MGDVDFWEVMDVMVYVANSRKNNANKKYSFLFVEYLWCCYLALLSVVQVISTY